MHVTAREGNEAVDVTVASVEFDRYVVESQVAGNGMDTRQVARSEWRDCPDRFIANGIFNPHSDQSSIRWQARSVGPQVMRGALVSDGM